MRNVDKLNPPIQYSWIWLLIGGLLVLSILIWYGVAFWLTRRRKPKSLAGLRQLPPPDLNQLKAKYLMLIDQLYQQYVDKQLTLRQLHQQLSLTVRDFVQEGNFLPAPYMTLSDLRQSPYQTLAKLIEAYYPDEFSTMTTGDAVASVQAAKGVVTQWPY